MAQAQAEREKMLHQFETKNLNSELGELMKGAISSVKNKVKAQRHKSNMKKLETSASKVVGLELNVEMKNLGIATKFEVALRRTPRGTASPQNVKDEIMKNLTNNSKAKFIPRESVAYAEPKDLEVGSASEVKGKNSKKKKDQSKKRGEKSQVEV